MRNEMLVEAREQRGWTQEAAAEKIGVSRVAYARWEEQGVQPRLWAINKACKAFNMTPEQLGLGFKKHSSNTTIMPPVMMSATLDVGTSATEIVRTGILALTLAWQTLGCTLDELQVLVAQELRTIDMEQPSGKNVPRRDMLRFLMSLPVAFTSLAPGESLPSLPAEEIFPLFVSGVSACWKLYFDGGMAEVEDVLPGYLSQLATLTTHSSYQKLSAGYASQAHQLGYLIAIQHQNFSVAQSHAKQAFHFAEIADDPHLRLVSLVRQGNLFFTLKRPIQTMQKYQEAIQYVGNASPLLVGQAYIGLAEASARLGMKQEALRFKGLAQDVFPLQPEQDMHFAYTHFNHFTRMNFEGLMYLHLEQPKEAWNTFAQIESSVPTSLVPQRVELLSRQALTSVSLGDLDQSCTYVEMAATAASKIDSDLRFNEVCETYLHMQNKWKYEPRIKSLAGLFQQ